MFTGRSVRIASRIAVPLFLLALFPFVTAAPASASGVVDTAPVAWPWTNTANTSNPYQGGVCTIRTWSSAGTTDGAGWAWDNTHTGHLAYWCDFVTQAAHPAVGAPVDPSTDGDVPELAFASCLAPLNRSGYANGSSTTPDPTRHNKCSQSQNVVPTERIIDAHFAGSNAQWVRITGEIVYMATCQQGGSNSGCGAALAGGATADPLDAETGDVATSEFCGSPTLSDGSSFGAKAGSLYTDNDHLAGGAHASFACYAQAGQGIPTQGPTQPDGSTPPVTSGSGSNSCHVTAVHVSETGTFGTDMHTGPYTLPLGATPVKSVIVIAPPVTLRVAVTMTFVGAPVGLTVEIDDFPTDGGSQIRRLAMPVTTSGAVSQVDVPYTLAEFLDRAGNQETGRPAIVFARCSVGGVDLDQRQYVGPGDTDPAPYHPGPGGVGSPIPPQCILNPDGTGGCTYSPGGGGPSPAQKAIACWSGFATTKSFLSVKVPWVNVEDFPGDLVCFVQEVTVGDSQDWGTELSVQKARLDASPLGGLNAFVALPFNAWTSFESSANTGDCSGVTVSYPQVSGAGFATTTRTIHPFDACSAPISTGAEVVRIGLEITVWLAAFMFSLKLIASTLGVGPVAAVSSPEISGPDDGTSTWTTYGGDGGSFT